MASKNKTCEPESEAKEFERMVLKLEARFTCLNITEDKVKIANLIENFNDEMADWYMTLKNKEEMNYNQLMEKIKIKRRKKNKRRTKEMRFRKESSEC